MKITYSTDNIHSFGGVNIALLLEAGLFEEIIFFEDGKQNLKNTTSNDTIYSYIVDTLKELADIKDVSILESNDFVNSILSALLLIDKTRKS